MVTDYLLLGRAIFFGVVHLAEGIKDYKVRVDFLDGRMYPLSALSFEYVDPKRLNVRVGYKQVAVYVPALVLELP